MIKQKSLRHLATGINAKGILGVFLFTMAQMYKKLKWHFKTVFLDGSLLYEA